MMLTLYGVIQQSIKCMGMATAASSPPFDKLRAGLLKRLAIYVVGISLAWVLSVI